MSIIYENLGILPRFYEFLVGASRSSGENPFHGPTGEGAPEFMTTPLGGRHKQQLRDAMTSEETRLRVHTDWRDSKGTTAGTLDHFVVGVRAGTSVAGGGGPLRATCPENSMTKKTGRAHR